MILIDTNIFVDHLRNFTPATKFLESVQQSDGVIFSAITEAELVAGKDCNELRKKEALLHLLHNWIKIPVTNPVAVLAGDIVRVAGLDVPDAIIAATTLLNDADLITRNVKDFRRVKGLKVRAPY